MNALDATLVPEAELARTKTEAYAATFRKLAPPRASPTSPRSAGTARSGWPAAFEYSPPAASARRMRGTSLRATPEFTDTFWVNPFGMHFGQSGCRT